MDYFFEEERVEPQLPSMRSLGFREKCAKSFPYHPGIDIIEEHLEQQWIRHQKFALEKRVPRYGECQRRWWRSHFNRWLKANHINTNVRTVSEESFFEQNPHLKTRWELYKTKVVLLKSRRDQFGTSMIDFNDHLQREWFKHRKFEFMLRELGFRPDNRKAAQKRNYVKWYANALLGCAHSQCWPIRVSKFPFTLIWYIKFRMYYTRYPRSPVHTDNR